VDSQTTKHSGLGQKIKKNKNVYRILDDKNNWCVPLNTQRVETEDASTLVLLASTFFPKCPLAPATEKSDGETGVLLAAGSGELKFFDKERESHCCAGGL
jgi:hypothetical protein